MRASGSRKLTRDRCSMPRFNARIETEKRGRIRAASAERTSWSWASSQHAHSSGLPLNPETQKCRQRLRGRRRMFHFDSASGGDLNRTLSIWRGYFHEIRALASSLLVHEGSMMSAIVARIRIFAMCWIGETSYMIPCPTRAPKPDAVVRRVDAHSYFDDPEDDRHHS